MRLDKISFDLYGKSLALLRVIEVRLNSIQLSLASILRIQSSLKIVQTQYGSDDDYPSKLEVDDIFFKQVAEAESAVRPLSFTSLLMQRHKNTLADVTYMFGNLYQWFCKHETYAARESPSYRIS